MTTKCRKSRENKSPAEDEKNQVRANQMEYSTKANLSSILEETITFPSSSIDGMI